MDFLILFLISLGVNIILLIFYLLKKPKKLPSFEESFYILNSIIEIHRKKYYNGLNKLSRRYAILQSDGTTTSPNDSVEKYASDKRKLKTAMTKRVVRCISKEVREKILNYYTERGLIDFLITELDKDI